LNLIYNIFIINNNKNFLIIINKFKKMKKKQGAFNNLTYKFLQYRQSFQEKKITYDSNNLTTDKDSKKNINTSKNVNLE
jgi:hypothetical protein